MGDLASFSEMKPRVGNDCGYIANLLDGRDQSLSNVFVVDRLAFDFYSGMKRIGLKGE